MRNYYFMTPEGSLQYMQTPVSISALSHAVIQYYNKYSGNYYITQYAINTWPLTTHQCHSYL
jgi:hypothetical protein